MSFRWKVVVAALAAGVMASGCLSVSRSRAEVTVTGTTTVSKGQELTDLQRALEAGAISPADYQKVRARILRRDN